MLEAGPQVGHAVRQWTILFRLGDKAVERLLTITGWNSPDPHVYPTGAELVETARYQDVTERSRS